MREISEKDVVNMLALGLEQAQLSELSIVARMTAMITHELGPDACIELKTALEGARERANGKGQSAETYEASGFLSAAIDAIGLRLRRIKEIGEEADKEGARVFEADLVIGIPNPVARPIPPNIARRIGREVREGGKK